MRGASDGGLLKGELASGAVISTWRLAMRKPSPEDDAAIAELAANPRVIETISATPGEGGGPDCLRLAIVAREDGAVIGEASSGAFAGRPGSVEIAAWIGEPYWGRGYATEAAQALIDHVFADESIQSVWSASRASSIRSRRVIEKCGFQYRGTGMVRCASRAGAVPVERFVLERRNWQSLKAWGAVIKPKESGHAPRDNAA
jgi:RimJ/RimL family protein N-acetyltransferase